MLLDNHYYLAFRGTAGINSSVYDAYTSSTDDDDAFSRSTMPCGCLGVDGRAFCDRHYKSRIINLWTALDIREVRHR